MANSPPAKKQCVTGQQSSSLAGTIRFVVKEVSKLPLYSPVCVGVRCPSEMIGDFPWSIAVSRSRYARPEWGPACDLHMQIFCDMSEKSNLWYCYASVEAVLINQDNAADSITKAIPRHNFLWDDSASRVTRDFDDWKSIIDPSKGFAKNDSIIVEARITVDSSGKRFRARPESSYDFSSPSRTADVILVVEDQVFHVSKQLLAIHSSVFGTLFYEEFKEKNEEKIELKDVTAEEFTNLLLVVYPSFEGFNDLEFSVIVGILKLADRWDMKFILDRVERHFMDVDDEQLMIRGEPCVDYDVFLLAEQYRLRTLYHDCLHKFNSCQAIERFRASQEYKKFSKETVEDLFTQYTKLANYEPAEL